MLDYKVLSAGDTAIVVEFGDRVDPKISAAVLSLAKNLDAQRIAGIIETVPTFRSLMIYYEPLVLPASSLVTRLDEEIRKLTPREIVGRLWHLPVCYGSRFASD